MVTADEIGRIAGRLALADEEFLLDMIEAAENAGEKLLPGDVDSLMEWGRMLYMLREALKNTRPDTAVNK